MQIQAVMFVRHDVTSESHDVVSQSTSEAFGSNAQIKRSVRRDFKTVEIFMFQLDQIISAKKSCVEAPSKHELLSVKVACMAHFRRLSYRLSALRKS